MSMTRRLILLATLALPALGLATLAQPALACSTPGNLSAIQADMIGLINAQRQSAGMGALAASGNLNKAAQAHACDNATRTTMSHKGADGSNFSTRIKRTGYRHGKANENVGFGFKSPSAMVKAWMGSSGHRKNILASGTREIGVGMAQGADGNAYWVMVSAQPK